MNTNLQYSNFKVKGLILVSLLETFRDLHCNVLLVSNNW